RASRPLTPRPPGLHYRPQRTAQRAWRCWGCTALSGGLPPYYPYSATCCQAHAFSLPIAPVLPSLFSHIPPNYVVEGASRSTKASRGEELEVEEPVVCRYASAFHFHPTLASVLGPSLIWNEVV